MFALKLVSHVMAWQRNTLDTKLKALKLCVQRSFNELFLKM